MTQDSPHALIGRANALMDQGRDAEAAGIYRGLLAQFPHLADSWFNLAYLERRLRRFEPALVAYGEAIARGVRGAEEAHLNRAVILSDHLARSDEAEAELRKALVLAPRYVPALLNLGNLCEDSGRREDARELYARALEADPGSTLALGRLAMLGQPTSSDDPLIAQLRTALARPQLNPGERAEIGFALGTLLDRCGSYEAAFGAFAEANRAARAAFRAFPAYDRKGVEQMMARLRAAFPGTSAVSEAPDRDAAPVFILGMFRSGSTLTEQILSRFAGVTAGGELDLIPAIVQSLRGGYPEQAAALGEADLARLAGAYRAGIEARHGAGALAKGMVTDKRPDNFLHIGLIKRLFPKARFVHTVRNPLDNALSIHFLHLSPQMAYGFDLADTGHWYAQYQGLMGHWKSVWGEDILDVDYDALVRDPEGEARRLAAFLGLEWDPACLDFHLARNSVKTASAWQVREPLYTRASGRWRHYAGHLEALRAELGDSVPT